MTPTPNPKSPTRLTMNAFLAASAAERRRNQKPIRRYEQRPTASQKTNKTRKLLASTSISMEKTNSGRYAKKRWYPGSSCI